MIRPPFGRLIILAVVGFNFARKHMVGRDYFETAGIQILAGRSFQRQDEETRAAAVIVSRQAVREFWKGESPVWKYSSLHKAAARAPPLSRMAGIAASVSALLIIVGSLNNPF